MTRAFQKPLGVLAYYWSEGDDSDLKLFENELSDRGVQRSEERRVGKECRL